MSFTPAFGCPSTVVRASARVEHTHTCCQHSAIVPPKGAHVVKHMDIYGLIKHRHMSIWTYPIGNSKCYSTVYRNILRHVPKIFIITRRAQCNREGRYVIYPICEQGRFTGGMRKWGKWRPALFLMPRRFGIPRFDVVHRPGQVVKLPSRLGRSLNFVLSSAFKYFAHLHVR